MAVVEPRHLEAFMAICAKWEVEAVVVGEVTDGDQLVIDWHGERVVDVPPRSVAHDGPTYERPFARPAGQDALQADAAEALPRPMSGDELRDTLLRLVGSPNLADKSWVTDQYDRYVQGNTVLAQPEDAGIIRVDEESHLGVAVSTDCNGRFAQLDPYAGAQLALAEAYRNVAVTGAQPLAVTDCLNFGSPEDSSGHVAVRAGHARPQGRLRRARHPGHRRQRVVLQPDRRHPDPADARRRRARRHRRRPRAHHAGVRSRRRARAAARRDPRGAERLHLGRRRPRPPRRPAAGRRPRRRAGPGRAAARGGPARTAVGRARPVRRRPRHGARRGLPRATTSASTSSSTTRSSTCSASRPPGRSWSWPRTVTTSSWRWPRSTASS